MRTVLFFCFFGTCFALFGQDRRVVPHGLILSDTPEAGIFNPLDHQVSFETTFEVHLLQAEQLLILNWDAEQEALSDSLVISVLDDNDWSPIASQIISNARVNTCRFSEVSWPKGTYIIQVNRIDGTGVMLLKFDWGG
jgi:hypothetical protein